jgi:hypothetical protein
MFQKSELGTERGPTPGSDFAFRQRINSPEHLLNTRGRGFSQRTFTELSGLNTLRG